MPELVKTIMKSKSDSEIMLESVCTEENIELVRKEVMDLADNVDYKLRTFGHFCPKVLSVSSIIILP